MAERKRITVSDVDVLVRVHELNTGVVYEGPWGKVLGSIDLKAGGTLHVSLLTDDPIMQLQERIEAMRETQQRTLSTLRRVIAERDAVQAELERMRRHAAGLLSDLKAHGL